MVFCAKHRTTPILSVMELGSNDKTEVSKFRDSDTRLALVT